MTSRHFPASPSPFARRSQRGEYERVQALDIETHNNKLNKQIEKPLDPKDPQTIRAIEQFAHLPPADIDNSLTMLLDLVAKLQADTIQQRDAYKRDEAKFKKLQPQVRSETLLLIIVASRHSPRRSRFCLDSLLLSSRQD